MGKVYRVEFSRSAEKDLAKMDRNTSSMIATWIKKNLEATDDPRRYGKALGGDRGGEWSYRIGSYRVLADIRDDEVLILLFKIGHRSKVYKWA